MHPKKATVELLEHLSKAKKKRGYVHKALQRVHPGQGGPRNNQGLTVKQAIFVKEYLVDFNQHRAARAAGYALKTANNATSAFLLIPAVRIAIREGIERISQKCDIQTGRVIRELARIAMADLRDLYRYDENGDPVPIPLDQLSPDVTAAVASLEFDRRSGKFKYKLHDKNAALNLLAKYLGVVKDEIVLTGPGGGPVQVADVSETLQKYGQLFSATDTVIDAEVVSPPLPPPPENGVNGHAGPSPAP